MSENKQNHTLYKFLLSTLSIPDAARKISNTDFKKLIEKSLNIYKNICPADFEGQKILIEKYNTFGEKFSYLESFEYDQTNLQDDTNYLKIFIKNIFNIDLENFDLNNVSHSTNSPTSFSDNQLGTRQISDSTQRDFDIQKNAFFIAPAQIRVQSEIKQGKIFAFDSKPKIIPTIKLVAGILLLFAAAGSILLATFMLIANNAVTPKTGASGEPLKINNSWSAMIDFLMGCVYLSASYRMLQPIFSKKNINENKKYYLAWQPIIFVGIFFMFSLVMEIFSGADESTIFSLIKAMEKIPANEAIVFALESWYVLNIFSYISLLLIGAVIGLSIFYNPKYDTKKLDQIVKQYIDEMVSGIKQ